MNIQSTLRISGGLGALALLLASGSASIAAQSPDSKAISALFSDARYHASLAEQDADVLETYSTSLAWKSHAVRLNAIKDHVNDLGRVSRQLADLSDEGSPWQREAIKQVDPLLRGMAGQLTTTITHLNSNHARTQFGEYRDFVRANHDLASRTADLMNDIVEYDRAHAKARSIEQKLELTADMGE